MKEGIHPPYQEVAVECACGNRFVTRSTVTRIRMEICSQCHPFYTGRQRLIDTAGRVERFEKRFAKTGGKTVKRKPTVSHVAPPLPTAAARRILRNLPVAAPVKPKPKPKTGGKPAPKAAKPS